MTDWKKSPDTVEVTITAKQPGRKDYTETAWLDAPLVGHKGMLDDPVDAWTQYSAVYLRRWIEKGRKKDERAKSEAAGANTSGRHPVG